jgi:hypothetical protein
MLNQGKCKGVRIAITEQICEEFRSRQARICDGCPGPYGDQQQGSPSPAPEQEAANQSPGFFVDFTGHEDLLQTWTAAAAERGLDPGGAALDIIYLFTEGLLYLKRKP